MPVRSMTGFGSAQARIGDRVFVIELRSVNHRYCDVRVHLPPELTGLEGRIEALVRRRVERGRVEVGVEVSFAPGAIAEPRIDLARARGYRAALDRLAADLGIPAAVSLELIASAPGVVRPPDLTVDLDELSTALEPAFEAALRDLLAMRDREGEALAAELQRRLVRAQGLVGAVRSHLPGSAKERRARLEARMNELLGDRALDPGRLAMELAVLADRADVSEELARLDSHFAQLELLRSALEPVGRKLDFLLQELNREANTIGSKTASAAIAHVIVELKAELERMREQVQNVE